MELEKKKKRRIEVWCVKKVIRSVYDKKNVNNFFGWVNCARACQPGTQRRMRCRAARIAGIGSCATNRSQKSTRTVPAACSWRYPRP